MFNLFLSKFDEIKTEISKFSSSLERTENSIKDEFQFAEPKLEITCTEVELPAFVVDADTQNKLLNAVYACPHGVLEMSSRMEGMVETSTNLASVKFTDENKIVVTTSQRSEIEGRKYYAAETVKAVFNLAGATVKHSDGYPGWTPNPDSEVLRTTVDSYKKLFGVGYTPFLVPA